MAKYLISFPSAAMMVPDGELEAVGRDAHAVIDEAKAAGVYVFAGGIDESVPPALLDVDATRQRPSFSPAPHFPYSPTMEKEPSLTFQRPDELSHELRYFQVPVLEQFGNIWRPQLHHFAAFPKKARN